MKERFIEFAALVVDIAINPANQSSLDLCSRESLPPEHRGRIKVRDGNGRLIDDDRFESNFNIFPNVLSNMARRLNQVLHIDEYAYQWFEYDFDKQIIVPTKNPAAVKEKAIDILTYATQHDCWNYDHFWNIDGQIKELIYLEKSYVIGLLNRHHIKNPFKPDAIFDAHVEQQPHKSVEQLYELLKGTCCDELEITRQLIKDYQPTDYRLGKLLKPDPPPPDPDPKKTRDVYRKRGTVLRQEASSKEKNRRPKKR